MRLGVAEIDQYAVTHVPRDEAIEPSNDLGYAFVVRRNYVAKVFRVEPRGQRRRADQVAEHYRELPPFRRGYRAAHGICRGNVGSIPIRRSRVAEGGDGVE